MREVGRLSDEEITQIVRTEDKELYAEVIKRYENKLLRYASNLLGDEQLAADAVQQGFIKAYVNLNGFDIKKKFSSWIYRIVHNEAMNLFNKSKKQVRTAEIIEYDSGIDLEDDIIKKELSDQARYCLDRMPIKYREPLSLFYLEEKSYEEISDILRIPIGTVGTRVSRAKGIMRKICQKQR